MNPCQKRFSIQQQDEVIKRYKNGETMGSIGKSMGFSINRIHNKYSKEAA